MSNSTFLEEDEVQNKGYSKDEQMQILKQAGYTEPTEQPKIVEAGKTARPMTEEDKAKLKEQKAGAAAKATNKVLDDDSPFAKYVNSLGEKYVQRCQEMAQLKVFEITLQDPKTFELDERKYQRRYLTNDQLEEIENLREEANEISKDECEKRKEKYNGREYRKRNGKYYSKIATCVLWDAKAGRFITEEEYGKAVTKDTRPILDGSILGEMAGVPN